MRTFFLLLLLFHVASTAKHSLEYFFTSSNGLGEFPEFVGTLMVDGTQFSYWDSNSKTVKTDDWTREFMRDNPDHQRWYSTECLKNKQDFGSLMSTIRQHLNQSEGVHILQMRGGCEWDEETEETASFMTYGYDGGNFMALDTKKLTWRALKPEALSTKLKWDTYKHRLEYIKRFYVNDCPIQLKKYVPYVRKVIQQRVLPSVSLLQKSPSSPVRCFATGFYPDRAVMFWRKDGEELHEGVDHGEILPNNDHTFQMSADLNISSEKLEDWKKYECVFQLSGVMEDIVTRLEKPPLTNTNTNTAGFNHWWSVSAGIAGIVALLLVCLIIRFLIWRKKEHRMMQASAQTRLLSFFCCCCPDSHHTPAHRLIPCTTLLIRNSAVSRNDLPHVMTRCFPKATIPMITEELLKLLPFLPSSVTIIVLRFDDTTVLDSEHSKMDFASLLDILKDTEKTIFISGTFPYCEYEGECFNNLLDLNNWLENTCSNFNFIITDDLNML